MLAAAAAAAAADTSRLVVGGSCGTRMEGKAQLSPVAVIIVVLSIACKGLLFIVIVGVENIDDDCGGGGEGGELPILYIYSG